MRFKDLAIIAFVVFSLKLQGHGTTNIESMAMRIYEAHLNKRPLQILSVMNPALTEISAYRVQKSYVKLRLLDEQIMGFKAGLTNVNIQKQLKINNPVSGVLFGSGNRKTETSIKLDLDEKLMLEVEIGFIIGEQINKPISQIEILKKRIKAVVPAIEITNLTFEKNSEIKGVDVIANNVSAYGCIIGRHRSHIEYDLKKILFFLWKEEELVSQGSGSDVLGDPWEAALWLVNNTVNQGWTLEPGHVLLTGSMGNILPARPGKYVADFVKLGCISFVVD